MLSRQVPLLLLHTVSCRAPMSRGFLNFCTFIRIPRLAGLIIHNVWVLTDLRWGEQSRAGRRNSFLFTFIILRIPLQLLLGIHTFNSHCIFRNAQHTRHGCPRRIRKLSIIGRICVPRFIRAASEPGSYLALQSLTVVAPYSFDEGVKPLLQMADYISA